MTPEKQAYIQPGLRNTGSLAAGPSIAKSHLHTKSVKRLYRIIAAPADSTTTRRILLQIAEFTRQGQLVAATPISGVRPPV